MWLWALTAAAAPYRTGHHHAEYDWYTLRTRWFRIHYPVGTSDHPVDASDTAQRIAAVADPMLLRLGAHTGWVPHGPIHVVVSDEADGMSAYTLPAWGWIVLSADPGVEVGRFRIRKRAARRGSRVHPATAPDCSAFRIAPKRRRYCNGVRLTLRANRRPKKPASS